MTFIKRFSIRQELSLAVILISLFFILFIFWYRQNPTLVFLQFVSFFILVIIICIIIFISEYFRKSEIQQKEENYRYESNFEKEFANYLKRKNIRYQLHPRLKVKGKKGNIICKPDFYLPEFEVYVEIWGKIDDVSIYTQKILKI